MRAALSLVLPAISTVPLSGPSEMGKVYDGRSKGMCTCDLDCVRVNV